MIRRRRIRIRRRRRRLTKLTFGSKAPLKKLRNLSLSLVRGPRRFWSWLKGLDWLKMVSRWLRSLIGRSSEQQQLDWELWGGLLDTGRFWRKTRGSCLARRNCLISLNHLQGTLYRHLYCWTLGMMIKMNCWQFKRKCSLLKSSFCLSVHVFCNFFFVSLNMSTFLGQKRLYELPLQFQHCV